MYLYLGVFKIYFGELYLYIWHLKMCNKYLNAQVSDVGASMLVHVFGAYFGLAVSCVLRRDVSSEKEGATYNSDIFAMIGISRARFLVPFSYF